MERKQQHKVHNDPDDDDDDDEEQNILVYDLGGGTFGKANTGQKARPCRLLYLDVEDILRTRNECQLILLILFLTTQLLIRFLFYVISLRHLLF